MSNRTIESILRSSNQNEFAEREYVARELRIIASDRGWVTPDGFGFLWYHPDLTHSNGDPITMTATIADDVMKLDEERGFPFGREFAVKEPVDDNE